MKKAGKGVDILGIVYDQPEGVTGLKIVTVDTTDPDPVTFIFEGTKLPLGMEIFEVPVGCYPLRKGDRFLAYPLVGQGASQRWGIVQKLTGGIVLATMASANSLTIAGTDKTYAAADLVIPPYFAVADDYSHYSDVDDTGTTNSDDYLLKGDIAPLKAGDTVSIAPTWDAEAEKIKYVILERY